MKFVVRYQLNLIEWLYYWRQIWVNLVEYAMRMKWNLWLEFHLIRQSGYTTNDAMEEISSAIRHQCTEICGQLSDIHEGNCIEYPTSMHGNLWSVIRYPWSKRSQISDIYEVKLSIGNVIGVCQNSGKVFSLLENNRNSTDV